MQQNHSWFTIS